MIITVRDWADKQKKRGEKGQNHRGGAIAPLPPPWRRTCPFNTVYRQDSIGLLLMGLG